MLPKLVRDKIPEIIAKDGRTVVVRLASDEEEKRYFLMQKLIEELEEFNNSETRENKIKELADIIDVVYALGSHIGIAAGEISDASSSKRKANGGFGIGWILEDAGDY
jgi:predicted house-cleaning noncanonical NTP pyrophosphatase (MazG superfamily)